MRFDPFGDAYSTDPAAIWRNLLQRGDPVTYDEDLDLWLIAGHDLARSVLADSRRFSSATTMTPVLELHPQASATLACLDVPPVALTADPPVHARTRAALTAVIPTTPSRAEDRWGYLVRARADELAEQVAHQINAAAWPDADLVEVFTSRFALYVMLDVLGLPADTKTQVTAWADNLNALIWGQLDEEEQISASNGLHALWDFCRDIVVLRAGIDPDWQPAGLIGDLLAYRAGDDRRLSLPETSALVLTLILAGWETTAAALTHALDHALRDRGRWAQLAVDEHYATIHAEEALRHSPAVDGVHRVTTTDVDLDGTVIPAGSRCLILIGAANHDPAVFEQPETFHPGRAHLSQHLSFGAGIHQCIVAALARLELIAGLSALARRLPDLTLAHAVSPRYRPSTTLRMHTALPATLAPARCPVVHGHPRTAENR